MHKHHKGSITFFPLPQYLVGYLAQHIVGYDKVLSLLNPIQYFNSPLNSHLFNNGFDITSRYTYPRAEQSSFRIQVLPQKTLLVTSFCVSSTSIHPIWKQKIWLNRSCPYRIHKPEQGLASSLNNSRFKRRFGTWLTQNTHRYLQFQGLFPVSLSALYLLLSSSSKPPFCPEQSDF